MTEPSGIVHEAWNGGPANCGILVVNNTTKYSYLGNKISLGLSMEPGNSSHYVNISNCYSVYDTAMWTAISHLEVTNYTKINFPHSKLVVSITNTSLSISHPLFRNGTDKNDSFGPRAGYEECTNAYELLFSSRIWN